MLGKNQAKNFLKILWANFQSPYKSSQASALFHTSYQPSSRQWVLWSLLNLRKHLFSESPNECRKSFSTKTTDSSSFLLKTTRPSHCCESQTHYIVYLSVILSWIMSCFCSQKTAFDFRWKLYRYSSPCHLTGENSVSRIALWLLFVFFVFVFWPIETTTANMQSLTHSNPCKMY